MTLLKASVTSGKKKGGSENVFVYHSFAVGNLSSFLFSGLGGGGVGFAGKEKLHFVRKYSDAITRMKSHSNDSITVFSDEIYPNL